MIFFSKIFPLSVSSYIAIVFISVLFSCSEADTYLKSDIHIFHDLSIAKTSKLKNDLNEIALKTGVDFHLIRSKSSEINFNHTEKVKNAIFIYSLPSISPLIRKNRVKYLPINQLDVVSQEFGHGFNFLPLYENKSGIFCNNDLLKSMDQTMPRDFEQMYDIIQNSEPKNAASFGISRASYDLPVALDFFLQSQEKSILDILKAKSIYRGSVIKAMEYYKSIVQDNGVMESDIILNNKFLNNEILFLPAETNFSEILKKNSFSFNTLDFAVRQKPFSISDIFIAVCPESESHDQCMRVLNDLISLQLPASNDPKEKPAMDLTGFADLNSLLNSNPYLDIYFDCIKSAFFDAARGITSIRWALKSRDKNLKKQLRKFTTLRN